MPQDYKSFRLTKIMELCSQKMFRISCMNFITKMFTDVSIRRPMQISKYIEIVYAYNYSSYGTNKIILLVGNLVNVSAGQIIIRKKP